MPLVGVATNIDLPRKLRSGVWPLRRTQPEFMRLPRAELIPFIERWPLEGPQSWEQRKWSRIARERSLGNEDHMRPSSDTGRSAKA